jgi:hypothetical protein
MTQEPFTSSPVVVVDMNNEEVSVLGLMTMFGMTEVQAREWFAKRRNFKPNQYVQYVEVPNRITQRPGG